MTPNGRVRQLLMVGGALLAFLPGTLHAQLQERTGTVATGLLLRRMSGVKRILMIAAHPDDEDDALIAALARGRGIETAYLSLSRGDGGQNLLGPELWEGLGIIRTGELQAARKIDGGEQFFTRAFDFGFSKTAKETLQKWPEQDLMRDVVWRIRKFRPQVVITVFTGTPRDGHGQHQAAGIVARKAFEAAGDPTVFPDQLKNGVEAWKPLKLYQLHRRGGDGSTVEVETGELDPLLGRSHLQLGMQSRSMHRTQDMGMPQPLGPARSGVQLIASHTSAKAGEGIFAGVDTTISGMADDLHGDTERAVQAHLSAYMRDLRAADGHFQAADPQAIAPDLADAASQLRQAGHAAGMQAPLDFREDLAEKMDLATRAYMAAEGVELDVRSDDDLVTPGQTVKLSVRLWNGGSQPVHHARPSVAVPAGWTARQVATSGLGADGAVAPNTIASWTWDVTLSDSARLSKLYYLRQPRDGDLYRWPADRPDVWGLPRDPAPVTATVHFDVSRPDGGSVDFATHDPWTYVGVNKAKGQYTHPVLVVPAVSVGVTPDHMVWPQSSTEHRTIQVHIRSDEKGGTNGEVRLEAPAGWTITPRSRPYRLKAEDAEETVSFDVTPSGRLAAGDHVFRAVVRTDDGRTFREGFHLIDYPHIERALLFHDAASHVAVVPVKVAPGLRVGYVMGPGDPGFDAIRQLGVNVELLDPAQVREGDFGDFDVIVLGVRAYETRPDLREANSELLSFVKRGGTVVVQYNKYEYPNGGFAPYPIGMTRPEARVTNEHSPVTILHPDAPVFTTPNEITLADFDGWVHERGLYFLSTWDGHYMPMLAMNDPGEAPLKGSLMVAPLGKGVYVYAALAFFRQFPAGVPGAYRLFANLISLKASSWQAYLASQKSGG